METQEQIALNYSESLVGTIQRIIVDGKDNGFYIGRTEYDSPDVDPEVLIPINESENLKVGHFYEVCIEAIDDFNLIGKLVG